MGLFSPKSRPYNKMSRAEEKKLEKRRQEYYLAHKDEIDARKRQEEEEFSRTKNDSMEFLFNYGGVYETFKDVERAKRRAIRGEFDVIDGYKDTKVPDAYSIACHYANYYEKAMKADEFLREKCKDVNVEETYCDFAELEELGYVRFDKYLEYLASKMWNDKYERIQRELDEEDERDGKDPINKDVLKKFSDDIEKEIRENYVLKDMDYQDPEHISSLWFQCKRYKASSEIDRTVGEKGGASDDVQSAYEKIVKSTYGSKDPNDMERSTYYGEREERASREYIERYQESIETQSAWSPGTYESLYVLEKTIEQNTNDDGTWKEGFNPFWVQERDRLSKQLALQHPFFAYCDYKFDSLDKKIDKIDDKVGFISTVIRNNISKESFEKSRSQYENEKKSNKDKEQKMIDDMWDEAMKKLEAREEWERKGPMKF